MPTRLVAAKRVIPRCQVRFCVSIQIKERRREAVTTVLLWRTACGPKRILQPFGQRNETLTTQDDIGMFKARLSKTEMIQHMVQGLARDCNLTIHQK